MPLSILRPSDSDYCAVLSTCAVASVIMTIVLKNFLTSAALDLEKLAFPFVTCEALVWNPDICAFIKLLNLVILFVVHHSLLVKVGPTLSLDLSHLHLRLLFVSHAMSAACLSRCSASGHELGIPRHQSGVFSINHTAGKTMRAAFITYQRRRKLCALA